ncbi:MAG: serine/threonine protein kinase [Deltaproteobacteria bacterium]|nr:serine/threonine protein kinase [Deltaproteobacteria bacterium]
MSGVRPGDVIAGKFKVERVLGEGGMGYVVAAKHLQLGQMVALKFMRDEVCTPAYRSRFLREARNTVRLKSKHVSRVLDVGALDGGAPYMVMEYLEGTDLSDLLHKRGPVPVHEACEYILQACEAIAEAHGHGIVHRDLKPANLFLTRGQTGEPVVKVLDFGVSKVLDLGMDEDTSPGGRPRRHENPDSVVTKATDLLGSPSYMAPEQIVSARDADARSDVWSLGVILFRLTSGKAPFHASSLGELIQAIMHGPIPNLRDVKPDLPAGLEHVVARCMERDREKRLSDVVELARLLAPYAGPVATPSLERIAILGPALVASAPPPPQPSGPSYPTHGSAWTSGAPRASVASAPPAEKRELTAMGALVWGGFFVLIVAAGAVVAAQIAHRLQRASGAAASSSVSPATAVPVPSDPPIMPIPLAIDPPSSSSITSATTTASGASPPPTSPIATAVTPAKAPHGPAHVGGGRRPATTTGAKPAAGEIPASRD